MPEIERFEILVIGSGEAGKHLTWTMAYAWAGPNYGASSSLANQMADAERDRTRRKN